MDKKKKENPNQKTLFQSWGNNKQTLKTEERKTPNNDNNIIEIIDLDDDDEDDGLLAAALEMESVDLQITTENTNHLQNSSCAMKYENRDVSNISPKQEEAKELEFLPGFDMENGNVWIYPTNYPIRDYQFQIVEEALYKNTLVTLPTGLGKTFIAAVLMYNYYRWYPQGKIIFMAPTKPLVAQQIEACYNIMGIPESHTAQMTGTTSPTRREEMWKNKRVFFLTPQVLQNDLSRGSCCADDVVLLVFDEAHKALGNHAYCQVVREVSNYTKNFRVLALSATPGDDVKAVQQVMTNLLISHMELRSEDSPDIQPYTHSRTVEKVVVPLGDDITRIKTHFLKVLEGIVGRLFCNRALWQKDPQRVTKYMLLSGRDQFRKRNLEGYTNGQKGAIEGDFAMGISLYHAYELLHQHGILSFYNFIKAIMDGSKGMARAKTEIRRNSQFMEVMEELHESIECPPDETTAEMSALFSQFTSPRRHAMHKQPFDPSFKSHPKLLKLEEVIVEHFQKFASDAPSTCTSTSGCIEGAAEMKPVNTRVMIFSQYRDSVGEITAILNKHKPLVRVMSFIGQATTGKSSRGLSQKEQLEVVHRFRRGGYNTLVATCVGEEGLDIGDVDLIVCFDAHASPIRLVQRMGRTGRKRNGRIVVLVSQGKEEQIYKRSLSSKKSIHKAIVQGSKSFELYDNNPRMIPRHLTPNVLKMQMTVGNFVGNSKKKRKSEANESKSSSITSFLGKPGTSKSPNLSRKDDGFLTYEELIYWQENFKLPDCEAGTTPQNSHRRRSRKSLTDPPVKQLSLNEWMAWQNGPSHVHEITHSRRTEHLVEILEFIELHGENAEGGDDAYDVEMMTFLNEEDLPSPEDNAMIIGDDDDDDDDEQTDDPKSKTDKSKKKKKRVSNENDGEKKKSNAKQNNKTKSKKSKSVSPARQKARWREYLKMFENEDNDFDTGKNESKNREEKPDAWKINKRSNDEMPEILDVDVESEDKAVKGAEELLPEDDDAGVEEDDDAFEVSSQTFSDLLPPLTPQKVNVLRSRITDVTGDHAKDVPLPPSLDSLDEISPFSLDKNPKSCENEHAQKLRQDKTLSCKRKISQLNEPKRQLGEKLEGENKYKNLMFRAGTSCEIKEPPNFDLEFDFENEMDIKLENGNEKKGCKEFTKSSSKTSCKNNLLDEPPELNFGNECEELTSGKENSMLGNHVSSKTKTNLKVKSQKRNTVLLPKQTDLLVAGDDEDDFEEKPSPRSSKLKERFGFGAGIVCKNKTSEVFDDDIDIEVGDDSLADDILADLVEEEFERNNHSMIGNNQNFSTGTYKNSKDERKLFSERNDLCIDAKDVENHSSRNETAPKKSKLKLNSKDKSFDNSLKKSILKLGVFERNAVNSKKKPCNSVADSEEVCDQPPHEVMDVKNLESKFESRSILTKTIDIPGKSAQKKEDFNFKKPDAVLGNRSMKLNRSVSVSPKACRNTSHENAETGGRVLASSPSRMSLKLNSESNFIKKQDISYSELSSCGKFEHNNSNICDIQKNQIQSCSPLKDLCTSPCLAEKHSLSFDTSHNGNGAYRIDPYDSPPLRKPLRERLTNRGFEDVVNDINMRKCQQKDGGTILSDEDSPVLRNKSKTRTLAYVAAISPLQESQNSQSRKFEAQHEESPVIRRRSKAKIRNGNVFAIAESDEEFETEDEEFEEAKLDLGVLDEQKGRTNAKGLLVTSDSEEDFLVENQEECVQGVGWRHAAAQRKIVLQNSVKRKRLCSHPPAKKQKRLHANHFLDAEAVISGSDIDDFTDDESERGSDFDSFIDDSTQLTQQTPACKTSRNPRSPMDMGAVYRQSLMSPHARNLNFRTPKFRTDKNRYKMHFRPKRTGSESEAEETHAHESDLENELGLDSGEEDFEEGYSEESFYEGDENESPKSVTLEISPHTQSQVRRPLKRPKRQYVLNDSTDEDVIACKKTPLKTNTICNISSNLLQSTQDFNHKKPSTLPTLPPKTNSFVASSSIFTSERTGTAVGKASPAIIDSSTRGKASEWKFNKKGSISSSKASDSSKGGCKAREKNRLSATFGIDWDGNDSDLLEAMEGSDNKDSLQAADSTKNTNRSHTTAQLVQDQEMQDIAFAMAATDDDMSFEMSAEMPTFSLGLDVFGDDIDEKEQQSVLKPNRDQNHRAFSTEKNTRVLKDPSFSLKKQLLQQRQQDRQLAEQYGKQESKFTKIIPLQRSKESNTRAFSFKSSSAATVQPFNKGIQKSTTNPQNIIKNMSGSNTIFDGSSSGTDGCGVSSGRVTKNMAIGMQNSNGYTGIGTGKDTQTGWGIDSNDQRRNSDNITSTPVKTMKNIPKAFVSPSRRDRDKMVILVDTKEICNAQVISSLRRKHNIKAEVCQLTHCDYVVSNRVGVIRKVVSAVANGANASKLVEKMRVMCDLYDRPCLIIEKDRVKPGENERDWSKSHAYSHTLAYIAQTHFKVLFSESQEDTAALLTELASMEAKKKAAIQAPLTLNKESQQVFRFLLSIPRVSYITALNLCSSLRTLRDLISNTPEDLQTISRQLSQTRATEICNYLKHNFDETMTGMKKIS